MNWAAWIAGNEIIRNAVIDTQANFPSHLIPLLELWKYASTLVTVILVFDMYKRVTRRSSEQFVPGG